MACSLSYSGSGATTFDAEEDMEDTDCDGKPHIKCCYSACNMIRTFEES
jgi:hypothetical protein